MDTKHGKFCGKATLNGVTHDVYAKNGHFGVVVGNKFLGHVKKSVLRDSGIYCPVTRKKIYGKHGYVGAEKNKKAA